MTATRKAPQGSEYHLTSASAERTAWDVRINRLRQALTYFIVVALFIRKVKVVAKCDTHIIQVHSGWTCHVANSIFIEPNL